MFLDQHPCWLSTFPQRSSYKCKLWQYNLSFCTFCVLLMTGNPTHLTALWSDRFVHYPSFSVAAQWMIKFKNKASNTHLLCILCSLFCCTTVEMVIFAAYNFRTQPESIIRAWAMFLSTHNFPQIKGFKARVRIWPMIGW